MWLWIAGCVVRPNDTGEVGPPDPAVVEIPGIPDESAVLIPGEAGPDVPDTGPAPEEYGNYDDFFDTSSIQQVRISIDEASMKALERDPGTYVEGGAEINGVAFTGVGIRLKGSSTYQTFSGKPALKLKLNEFAPGQRYAGLERITLNNMTSDPAQSREVIAYHLYGQAGMTGPKANFAQVWVNDEEYGLYVNLESMDDHWLARRYEDPDGDLWGTASSGADFDRANVRCDWCYWVLKSGAGDTSKLLAVKEAIDDTSDDFEAGLGGVIDVPQYLDYWAWNTVLGNGDGYPWTTNDVFIYANPDDSDLFEFSPWGMDESFNSGISWSTSGTRLGSACADSSSCKDQMKERICADLDVWDGFDAAPFAAEVSALTEDAVATDPRRPSTPEDVSVARGQLGSLIAEWGDTMRSQNRCGN